MSINFWDLKWLCPSKTTGYPIVSTRSWSGYLRGVRNPTIISISNVHNLNHLEQHHILKGAPNKGDLIGCYPTTTTVFIHLLRKYRRKHPFPLMRRLLLGQRIGNWWMIFVFVAQGTVDRSHPSWVRFSARWVTVYFKSRARDSIVYYAGLSVCP